MIFLNIVIYLYFYYQINFFLELRKSKLNVLSTTKTQLYFSMCVCIIFFFSFFIFYRILRIFFLHKKNLDLKLYYNYVYFLDSDTIIFYIFLFFVFLLLKNYLFAYIRFSFLRVYFCFLLGIDITSIILPKISLFDTTLVVFFSRFLDKYATSFVDFMLYKVFKIILLIVFLFGILVNDGVIYTGILPWYGLYFCILSVFLFIKKLKINFDHGIYFEYEKIVLTNYESYYKLDSYQKYLITGESKYVFYDFVDMMLYGPGENVMYYVQEQDYRYFF